MKKKPVRKVKLHKISKYLDEMGNSIVSSDIYEDVKVSFRGFNNKLIIHNTTRLDVFSLSFECDDGYVEIKGHEIAGKGIKASIRVGEKSRVIIGSDLTCTGVVSISAAEGSSVIIGDDCMFASQNEVRSDDAHPIFDIRSGKRINMSQDVYIGDHVWLAKRAVVLGGSDIREGSVIGFSAVIKGHIPNNCIAVGIPARVIKKDIAWERPHLSISKPYVKPDKASISISKYWRFTQEIDDTEAK
ncbi:acyltransferase [Pusillimonas sp. ANT_WB101]|uniref:acyltransferase n=1 Tax=Pusillimonas sp. ANT_WB101 TaxID=2597356 RepID=UPI0011EFFAF4|nr:acyltransferase [Pusillimonas sp. ANT_WB101]KAA0911378.1 acyltransferase [Pusillimonas sp. ANT_WB101]